MICDFKPSLLENTPQQKSVPHRNQPTNSSQKSEGHGNSGNTKTS